ncbi:hypothetical protein RSOLAG22IIIB_13108 [Rhizoctonia solani]|uniref:Uncharacterized protein n=1 Tax=Rhizoctonia solani TaxID=456999 RepID=A0A0K6GIV4_9AGAM|nr:unnamed protein product [Rhizoctonia solani]CUA78386.1 hypothetical protein RSOLAG22IIIB_13108 [Rhizoctonia solani]
MEAKLKALKVADLKEILSKSSTPIPSKANKADLIAKILATPEALKLAGGESTPAAVEAPVEVPAKPVDDDLLAPPDEFDWDGTSAKPDTGASTEAKPAESVPAVESATTTTEPAAPTEDNATKPAEGDASTPAEGQSKAEEGATKPVDEELERRKARAARFGIPFVDNPVSTKGAGGRGRGGKKGGEDKDKPASKTEEKKEVKKPVEKKEKKEDKPKPMKISAKEAAPNDDDAKLAARAARFGITTDPKPAAGGSSDPAEEEKRKKREARFGAPASKKAKTEA